MKDYFATALTSWFADRRRKEEDTRAEGLLINN